MIYLFNFVRYVITVPGEVLDIVVLQDSTATYFLAKKKNYSNSCLL